MNLLVKELEQSFLKKQVPMFRAGDTVRVAVRIVEGNRERIQNFEGVCIGRRGSGMDETFTVRRVSFGVGMERTFSLHSPRVEDVQVIRHGRVRRAKLYYLRQLTGRKAKIKETRRKRGLKGEMFELLADMGEDIKTMTGSESPEDEQVTKDEATGTPPEPAEPKTEPEAQETAEAAPSSDDTTDKSKAEGSS